MLEFPLDNDLQLIYNCCSISWTICIQGNNSMYIHNIYNLLTEYREIYDRPRLLRDKAEMCLRGLLLRNDPRRAHVPLISINHFVKLHF